MTDVRFEDVLTHVVQLARGRSHARKLDPTALHRWLRFCGLKLESTTRQAVDPWRHWLGRCERFLTDEYGLALTTRIYQRRHARCFFGRTGPLESGTLSEDSAERHPALPERVCRSVRPGSTRVVLCSLRSFLRFVQLQGACRGQLAEAVLQVSNYVRGRTTEDFSEAQRRASLGAFSHTNARGRRNYSIALCLPDLWRRAKEVTQLRLFHVTRDPPILVEMATKTDPLRQLPLPAHVVPKM